MVEGLGYEKVCASWVTRLLTEDTNFSIKYFYAVAGTVCCQR